MSEATVTWPAEWTVRSLEKIASMITSGGTPTSGSPRYYLEYGGLPFAKTEDLTRAGSRFIEECELGISEVALKETAAKKYPAGTVFISMYGTIGLTKIAAIEMAANQALCALIPPLACDSGYLYHHLEYTRLGWLKYSGQTTQANINGATVRAHEVPLPDPSEQRKIAQVLDTLDTAIHETEAIIAKLKAVKLGLLHDLLTRGIDANGELRPPQTEAPHLYKESALGWIPQDWDVVRVGEDAYIEHGFAFPGHQFTDKEVGPALLVPGNFHREGGLYFTTDNTKYFSGKYPQQYVLSRGDVLVVMTDLSPMTLILGRTVVLNEEFKVLHNQRIGKFRFKKNGLWNPVFFAETLSQDAVRLKVIAEATGTTVRHTSPDRIKSCYVARPTPQEQQLAAQRIQAVDLRRKLEDANLLKLKQTKSGLMDDLLSGRVRVTPLLAEATQQLGSA